MSTKNLNITSFLVLLAAWLLGAYACTNSAIDVPIHWSLGETPDSYAGRWSFFIVPAIALLFFIPLCWVQRHIECINVPTSLGEKSKSKAIEMATKLCAKINLLLMLMLLFIEYFLYARAGTAILCSSLFFALLIVVFSFFTIIKILKMQNMKM